MDRLEFYLAQDRRVALARGDALPELETGTLIFADVSGFTPLTEAMTRALGPRRGADELTRALNEVYDRLLGPVEAYGGSVINFSGDAALCFFRGDDADPLPAAARALSCALEMQKVTRAAQGLTLPDGSRTHIALKIALTSGVVRRTAVGDPDIQRLELVVGDAVTRTAACEQLCGRDQVWIDEHTAEILGSAVQVREWVADDETGQRFGEVLAFASAVAPAPAASPPLAPPPERARAWVPRHVYEWLAAEQGAFLTELRPVVALFGRFGGLDYVNDPAATDKLNRFVVQLQQLLARYEGLLLELSIGDKGSYFYSVFGVPNAHEDDALRAVHAAREMLDVSRAFGFIQPLQIGISQGTMRVGAYGSATRRVYGAQGDEVNLAARFMMEAAPGEILVTRRVQQAVASDFDMEPLRPLLVKGKREPLLPFLVKGERAARLSPARQVEYALPLIGREADFQLLEQKLGLARLGTGQVVGITAPAGMGKSRFVGEIVRTARRGGDECYVGEFQSFGSNTSYLGWVGIWRTFFGLDVNLPMRRLRRVLEGELQDLAPERLESLPLLGAAMHLALPENEFTAALEPEFRKSALEALLVDCVRGAAEEARAQGNALVFVLEDVHWMDPASRDLVERVVESIHTLPVLIILTYRPSAAGGTATAVSDSWRTEAGLTEIVLAELNATQGEELVRAKLAQFAPENTAPVPPALIHQVTDRAQGNPFYIEELLNYMQDQGLDLRDPASLARADMPTSLERLILSRIDYLTEAERLTLKVASILGRVFRWAHLVGYYSALGAAEQVQSDLTALEHEDLLAQELDSPELTYLFKHILTQQVAYESLAFSTRAHLHGAYARFLESHEDQTKTLDLIAFHYDHGDDPAKRREYLILAGHAAAARFANREAVDYLTRALALIPTDELAARCELLTAREQVYDVMGDRERQRADLDEREQLAVAMADWNERVTVTLRRGLLAARTGEYAAAVGSAQTALELVRANADETSTPYQLLGEADALWGEALWEQGDANEARVRLGAALEFARTSDDRANQIRVLNLLGTIARFMGDYADARALHEQALALVQSTSDKRREWLTLNNLAAVAHATGDLNGAAAEYERALAIVHEIGDRRGEALLLSNLAITQNDTGEYDRAIASHRQTLTVAEAIRDRKTVMRVLANLGETYRLAGAYAEASNSTRRALREARELGDNLGEALILVNLGAIELAQGELVTAQTTAEGALARTRALGRRESEAFVLDTLGQLALARGEPNVAVGYFEQAVALWNTLAPLADALEAQAGLAQAALADGKPEALAGALPHCERILAYLTAHPERAGDAPALAAQWVVYSVLQALGDSRAQTVLADAQNALRARADKLADPALKQSFLENVRAHRLISSAGDTAARA